MLLQNLQLIGYEWTKDLRITDIKIEAIKSTLNYTKEEPCIFFDNAFAFPGLINSHDHLDFNLFPQLGNRIYNNYMEWGSDIHTHNKDIIHSVLRIPQQLRIEWGIYKNLLNGVTTVVHHGDRISPQNALINIVQDCYSLHSVGTEKFWRYKFNRPFVKNQPFVIHIGEGTDTASKNEIDELIKWNIFKREIIGIHGVAMNEKQANAFEALIWCPDSNLFLLGATAAINYLKKNTKIIFGTDSTISASWNLWDQIRLARKTNLLIDQELVDSLSRVPASVWKLNNIGTLAEGKNADLVIARQKATTALKSFFSLNPEDILLILREGQIVLFDETLLLQLNFQDSVIKKFSKIFMNNSCKYILGDLPALIEEIKRYNPDISFPLDV